MTLMNPIKSSAASSEVSYSCELVVTSNGFSEYSTSFIYQLGKQVCVPGDSLGENMERYQMG